ncbi:hypothetical protein [uncultured Pseudoteredinibacter sp.]|uniref:hypothetical protein n=1 Tax=uncultured Pseudoteredinibacter sp. TaxID=1641701 RepID=UPI00261C783F|nr:hypothetical protein [uncultured Pseudoteredinibacter sp.]
MLRAATFSTICLVASLGSSFSIADQTVFDDHIIVGNQCVGVDCSININFGFDGLVLKQNNTRILFQDTSNSASFPTNDWRLVANDSTNGGRNFFAIEDVNTSRIPFMVMAGAPENALNISNEGFLGLGTDDAQKSLHINSNNLPSIRLQQNSSGGFPASFWDISANELGLSFTQDNQSKLAILPNGDLNIAGDITTSVAEADFPDYVFANDYSLMPLQQLGEFVQKNHHLPEIPPAAEVAKDGLNMSQLQLKLLQKVEELTLYTVKQQQELEQLKAELASVRKQNQQP